MDRSEVPVYISFIGIAATILSFLLYVFFPDDIYMVTFAIGIVMMVGGYTVVSLEERKLLKQLESIAASEDDIRGEIISLDGPYVPYEDCASIEYLENHRCPR